MIFLLSWLEKFMPNNTSLWVCGLFWLSWGCWGCLVWFCWDWACWDGWFWGCGWDLIKLKALDFSCIGKALVCALLSLFLRGNAGLTEFAGLCLFEIKPNALDFIITWGWEVWDLVILLPLLSGESKLGLLSFLFKIEKASNFFGTVWVWVCNFGDSSLFKSNKSFWGW